MKAIETIKSQKREYRKDVTIDGQPAVIVATVRHDDDCGNGHNSFAVTADVYEPHYQRGEPSLKHASGKTVWLNACGCQHELVAEHFPELAHLIRWHLCSTDGPMHYVENALYWAGFKGWTDGNPNSPPNGKHLASTVVFGAVPQFDGDVEILNTDDEMKLRGWMAARLPDLLEAFRADVEAIGFVFGGAE